MEGFSREKLKGARLRLGLSQRAVPGVAQDTLSALESGRREPRPSTLKRLAEAYGVQVADFFEEAEESPKAPMTSVEEVLDAADAATQWAALSDEEWEAELEAGDPSELLRSVEAERMTTQALRHRLGQSGQPLERQLAGRMVMRYLTRAAQAARRTEDPEAAGKIEEMLAGVEA